MPKRWILARAAAPLAVALGLCATVAAAEPVVVLAAASLKDALEDAAAEWETRTDGEVALSFAGSAALARQVEAGAPADLFVSANEAWMDALEAGGLIRPETRRDLMANRLVLIAHGEAEPLEIGPGFDLPGRLGDGRLAMALVDAVPAGIYGREALTALGVWDEVAPRVAQADNVRAALALVARGEAPLGVVYATDARAEPRVSVMGVFPEDSHPPIAYPAAVVAESDHPEAEAFLDHLSSPQALALYEARGFLPPP